MHDPNREKNILIIVLIFVVVILGVLLVWRQKTPKPIPASPQTTAQNQSAAIDWSAKISEITTALTAAFPNEHIAERGPVSIVQTGDVTGDGVPEALVDMGTGGASTDVLSLVGLENGSVKVFSYTGADASDGPIELAQGSAVLHSNNVGLDTADSAIYSTEVDYSGADGSLASCTLDAYQWNGKAEDFEYSQTISDRLQKTYCATVANSISQ